MLTLSGSTIINLTLLTIFIEFGLPYPPHEDLHTRHKTSNNNTLWYTTDEKYGSDFGNILPSLFPNTNQKK